MEQKYEFTGEKIRFDGETLLRIRALKNFGDVRTGELGGFIAEDSCLSQRGDCWVYHNAKVRKNASITGDAKIYDEAVIDDCASISGCAKIYGQAYIGGTIELSGDCEIRGHAQIGTFI